MLSWPRAVRLRWARAGLASRKPNARHSSLLTAAPAQLLARTHKTQLPQTPAAPKADKERPSRAPRKRLYPIQSGFTCQPTARPPPKPPAWKPRSKRARSRPPKFAVSSGWPRFDAMRLRNSGTCRCTGQAWIYPTSNHTHNPWKTMVSVYYKWTFWQCFSNNNKTSLESYPPPSSTVTCAMRKKNIPTNASIRTAQATRSPLTLPSSRYPTAYPTGPYPTRHFSKA